MYQEWCIPGVYQGCTRVGIYLSGRLEGGIYLSGRLEGGIYLRVYLRVYPRWCIPQGVP